VIGAVGQSGATVKTLLLRYGLAPRCDLEITKALTADGSNTEGDLYKCTVPSVGWLRAGTPMWLGASTAGYGDLSVVNESQSHSIRADDAKVRHSALCQYLSKFELGTLPFRSTNF
jgi:hypothetical protein